MSHMICDANIQIAIPCMCVRAVLLYIMYIYIHICMCLRCYFTRNPIFNCAFSSVGSSRVQNYNCEVFFYPLNKCVS